MKIAIEAQRIFRKEKHGMDYVALETIRELQKIDQQNEYFILVSPGDDICLQESANMHIVTVNWPSYPLWEQIGLPLALKKNQTRPAALHKQHCPCVWKHSTGAYTARHYLSRKKTRQEPVHVPKTGTFLPKNHCSPNPYQMQKNHYRFSF